MKEDSENPDLPEALWSALEGRLWHATNRDGLEGIIERGEIRVSSGNRYTGSFCRCRGAVCLFDFGSTSRSIQSQFNTWSGWLGSQQESRVAIWLEVNRTTVAERLLDAEQACQHFDETLALRRIEGRTQEPGITFIAGVEACHQGPIPFATLSGMLLVDQHDRNIHLWLERSRLEEVDVFEANLPHHEDNASVRILQEGRRRAFDK